MPRSSRTALHEIALTVDAVILTRKEGELYALLVQRTRDPFKGSWAFPGGHLFEGEDLGEGARRSLHELTGLDVGQGVLGQLGAYGRPGRDPRGHTVSIAFTAFVRDGFERAPDAASSPHASWWRLTNLPALAFDHAQMAADALAALRGEDTPS